MANLIEWIVEEARGEEIEAVVIGEMGWGDYNSENVPGYSDQTKGEVITWEEAQKFLNYEFDSGYGAPKCNAIYAWTKSWIIAIEQYDGSVSPFSIPRNPIACNPQMPGQ